MKEMNIKTDKPTDIKIEYSGENIKSITIIENGKVIYNWYCEEEATEGRIEEIKSRVVGSIQKKKKMEEKSPMQFLTEFYNSVQPKTKELESFYEYYKSRIESGNWNGFIQPHKLWEKWKR